MGPSKPSSSKGKDVDKSTEWSEWIWDKEQNLWYKIRYSASGEVEWEYNIPDEQQQQTTQGQQEIPRSPGENIILNRDTNRRDSADATSTSVSNTAQTHPQPSSTNQSYYTTSPSTTSQTSTSRGISGLSYSNQPTGLFSSGISPTTGPSNLYTPFGSKSNYPSSEADDSGDVISSFRGLSLNYPPTIPEQDQHLESSGIIRRPEDSADREKLDPRYRLVADKDQRRFWKVGRVFMMLWTEPAKTMGGTRNGTHYSTVWLEQGAYSEIRRFVVIREGYGNSICSPIHTYSGQATLKPNLPERQQHAIIYTSEQCPPEHSYLAHDGSTVKENLIKDPIKVKREQSGTEGDLGVYSRLNYSKIYTVENYVRVLNIGIVERDWLPTLNANCYLRPVEALGPAQKPTNHKAPSGSGGGSLKDTTKKGKDSRRSKR